MYTTIDEWLRILGRLCEGTEYDAIINGASDGIAIVPKITHTPQRVAVYPKKTKNPGLVLEQDIDAAAHRNIEFQEPARIKSNRPHYCDVPENTVLEICKLFISLF